MENIIKILFILLLSIPLLGQSDNDTSHTLHTLPSAITTYNDDSNSGLWFNDSLWNDIYVPAEDTIITAGGDTTIVIDTFATRSSGYITLDFQYEWVYLVVQDTGTTYDDSLLVKQGTIKYANKIKSDTTWQNIPAKDSTFTTVNVLVDDNSVHGYLIYTPAMDLIKFELINAEAVANRVTRIWGSAKKK